MRIKRISTTLTPNGSSGYTSDPPRTSREVPIDHYIQREQEPSCHLGELTRFLLLFINGKEGHHGSGPSTKKTKDD